MMSGMKYGVVQGGSDSEDGREATGAKYSKTGQSSLRWRRETKKPSYRNKACELQQSAGVPVGSR